MFISYPHNYHFYLLSNYKEILTINSKNINIINNILHLEEKMLVMFYNFGTLNLGSNKTKTITIKDNKIKACLDSFLFNKISSITLISEEINFTNNNL